MAQRTKVVETELKIRQQLLHTIRVVGFILPAGGAWARLLSVRKSRFPPFLQPLPASAVVITIHPAKAV